ncbi:MAG TPA: DNA polymerase III subunit chi [Noviherbaspirillum sp.]|uniref:DNA polymerase III subunit chi n=1 Tax=Noviherbaspirillum sp. TaxID=1926288 RepID=UPI002D22C1DF|nr:DNA polymerase III subunit chi [Noviherbaspirillum sp.]HYD97533.1 DNA polymerase III subunit chi [Noviherbaspirillum sp.]
MTRIDFHSKVADRIAYACRLTRKARAANCQVVLLTRDRRDLMALDQALWTFAEQEFLPHVLAGDPLAASTPIILTDSAEAALPHHQVLVNLSAGTPAHFARFERMIEIVSADEADIAAGRARYRFYQQRGYPLTHFEADKA